MNAASGIGTDPSIDPTDCDREPIHVPGAIQPHGVLAAMTPDWRFSHVSANIASFSGRPLDDWLGRPVDGVITSDAFHALRNQIAMLHGPDAIQRLFDVALIAGRPAFDVALHRSGDGIIMEAEPAVTDEREAAALVRAMVARLKHSADMQSFLRDGARHVQALTGFDRVMVYRFDAAGDGEVIAEAVRGRQESYLGLHYPASDVPRQARMLYLRCPFRIIADVSATPVPVLALPDDAEQPLDQTLSVLRAVSPVHIAYLRNMGVAASLSISIIVEGRLWGLFACHHQSARLPSFAYRTAAELFGEMFSMMLEGRQRRIAAEYQARADALATLLIAEMEHDDELLANPSRVCELICDTIPADGVAIQIDGRVTFDGATPDEAQCLALTAFLAGRGSHGAFATDTLGKLFPAAQSYADRAVGCMAIPLVRSRRDYVLLFRGEWIRTVQWAGNPTKSASDAKLGPRESFAAWSDLVRGHCKPFTPDEHHAGETIRVALMEAILRRTGATAAIVVPARDGQDMLISELNHRVRNILALIRGLISQTRGGMETTESFIATLDDRVQSLARAHDQITSDRWGPASLQDLIETEADAYLGSKRDRVWIVGLNVLIQPTAFTTLALVFHELMTNAAKYGALSDSGSVGVGWRIEENGDLMIDWSESDGPTVSPPTRRGFGSTIIERSIPYDLGGTATVDYQPTGLIVCLQIPARHLAGIATTRPRLAQGDHRASDTGLLAGVNVLLVEDSMIIAMDCAETLTSLGARNVTMAASVSEAVAAMTAETFQFALLDFNLGSETSVGVADILAERGVPFAFATGYDGAIQDRGHANAPVLGKPYGRKQLVPLLLGLGFGGIT